MSVILGAKTDEYILVHPITKHMKIDAFIMAIYFDSRTAA